jgi:hypothetical protein
MVALLVGLGVVDALFAPHDAGLRKRDASQGLDAAPDVSPDSYAY